MSSDADAVCGVDVGSQGTVVAAFSADGEKLAASYQAYPVSYPRPGWAEQDPALWSEALVRGLAELADGFDLARIGALSFASQLDGLVCVDADGRPLRPAIIWMDRRADSLCREVAERVSPEEWYARSGCNLDGSHVAAKIAWAEREGTGAAKHLLPGAYMVRVATGRDAVDPSNASSTMVLDPDRLDWDEGLLAAFEIDPDRLPPIVPAHSVVDRVSAAFAGATGLSPETLVVCGCGDEMGATLGAGLSEPGEICDVLGTAEPVCAVSAAPLREASRIAECHPHAAPDRWLLESPGWASGAAYRWFRDELGGSDYEELNALAASVPPASAGLVFLPWMGGAMAPVWDADARGGWYGLTPAHGRAHLCRALLEGSAYAFRDVVDAIRAAGLEAERIVCVGGGARSPLVRQMRADVTGIPVGWSEDVETTARGAAMLAAAGAGLHESVAAAAASMCRAAPETHAPDDRSAELLDGGYRRYRRLFEALAPAFAELA